jgi:peptidyl-prolyl cis-trans isomerase SurA
MKKLILTLFLILTAASPLKAESQLLDQVAAVVNDEIITQSELDVLLRPLYDQYKKEGSPDEAVQKLGEARQKLLNQLVEDRLVFQEAKTQKIEIDENEIDDELARFKDRFKSDKELEDALQREGLSMKEMRERIRRQSMIRRLQDMEIRSRVVVSPLEIEKFYKENSDEFASGEKIRVRSITIRKDEVAREKGLKDERAKKRIEDLRKRIASGFSPAIALETWPKNFQKIRALKTKVWATGSLRET